MPNINYTIGYNEQIHLLEFKYELFPDGSNSPLRYLLQHFRNSLHRIMHSNYNFQVGLFSNPNSDGESILYVEDIQINERITDIVFSHGKYSDYKKHYPGFLSPEQFTHWQDAIKEVDKPAILKLLYQDNKISRAYFLKYSNHPASLYELGKYNLIDNFFGTAANQAKKIDGLTLPLSIKEDLKCCLSK